MEINGQNEIWKTMPLREIALKQVTSKGRKYVYVRNTGECLVRGFVGTDLQLQRLLDERLGRPSLRRINCRSSVPAWRMDAARFVHKVTGARARRLDRAYCLSPESIADMLGAAKDRCTITGLKFDYGPNTEAGWLRRPLSPSLDRIDNSRGYEVDNVRIVCTCVNIALGEWGLENFASVCRAFVERNGK